MTGALNHRGMHAAIPQLLAGSGPDESHLVLVILDLDRFKAINDTYGHHRGDSVLADLAVRLSAAVRREAVVARTGGEEFVVLDTVGGEGAAALGERIVRAVHRPESDIPVTASVGVGAFRLSDLAVDEPSRVIQLLLRQADSAMYSAKRAGGNRSLVYAPPMASP